MNLIEQLGGYDRAKKLVDDCKRYGRSDVKVPVNSGFIHIVADFLELDLLEYRRQHNIFEIDDYIIHDGELRVFAMWSSAVEGCAYIGYAYAEDGEMAHKDEFRHATDEEIKAGKRLEVR